MTAGGTERGPPSSTTGFQRDRLTLLAYGATAYGVYVVATLGPAMPLLRAELGISYTAAGLHFTFLALGAILAGSIMDRAMSRFGRRSVFWATGAGLAMAAALLAAAGHPLVTVGASFLIGLAVATLLAATQSSLAIRHGRLRTVALAEASAVDSTGFLVATPMIGILVAMDLDWRIALLVPAVVWPLAYFSQRGVPFPERAIEAPAPGDGNDRLPAVFWIYWTAILLGVAVEWTFVAWGASYVIERTGVDEGTAALVMTSLFVAMVIGRIGVSRLVRWFPPVSVALGGVLVAIVGFLVWWTAAELPALVAGGFVAGLGIAGFYPVLTALALGTAGRRTDVAAARVVLTAGLGLLIAPQALAAVADFGDLAAAYSLTLVGFALLAVVIAAGWRFDRGRQTRGSDISRSNVP